MIVLLGTYVHRRQLRRAVPHRPGRPRRRRSTTRCCVVSRWREERAHGRDNEEAVVVAMQTAGHAVVASRGVTVAISLLALLVDPGAAPAQHGPRRHAHPAGQHGGRAHPAARPARRHRPARRLAADPARGQGVPRAGRPGRALVVRRRWIAAGVALVILGAARSSPIFGIKIGQAQTDSLASSGPAYDTLQTLHDGGVGRRRPDPDRGAGRRRRPAGSADGGRPRPRRSTASAAAFAPDTAQWRTATHASSTSSRPTRPSTSTKARRGRRRARPRSTASPGVRRHRRRRARPCVDYIHAVYDKFPYVLGADRAGHVRAAGAHVPVAPAAAQGGAAQPGLAGRGRSARSCCSGRRATAPRRSSASRPTGAITFWLPVVIFAFLFGLSMDYEVFILARMREEYDETGDTDAGGRRRPRPHRPAGHRRRADPVLRLRRAGVRRRAPTSRCSRPRWASASCSTPPSSGPCWCRRWCAVRPVELVAARLGWPGCCGSSRTRPSPSRAAGATASWSAPTTERRPGTSQVVGRPRRTARGRRAPPG